MVSSICRLLLVERAETLSPHRAALNRRASAARLFAQKHPAPFPRSGFVPPPIAYIQIDTQPSLTAARALWLARSPPAAAVLLRPQISARRPADHRRSRVTA